jgi:hypothetical protein
VSDEPARRLAPDELLALKLAAHRQLAKLVTSSHLRPRRPRQLEQRAALLRAVRILEDLAFVDGCELRPTGDGGAAAGDS